jgi:YD repeat-containing protein
MLKQISDASLITAVAFDNAGRVAARVVQHRETQTKQAETFAYDLNGQLIQATNHSSTLNWYYNLAGQLIREHQRYQLPNAEYTAIWQHEYDVLGNRSATTRPDGTRTEWLTYGSGHVHGLLLNGIETIAFERDDLHREIERTQANHIAQTLQYDPAGRLKQQLINHVDAKQGINTTLNQRNYSYDTLGQLTQIGDTRRGQISYAYDPVGRLLQASSGLGKELFAFDPAGNISQTQTSNPNLQHNTIDDEPGIHQNTTKANIVLDNLLKQYVGTHYEYDERGNMVKRTHNGQVTTFKWNHFNRMVQSTSDDVQTHYAYDALGRRMVKHSQPIIDVPSGAGSGYEDSQRSKLINAKNLGITLYGWDGDTLAWESTYGTRRHINEPARQIEAAFDTSQTTHYIYEPNSFVPMLQASRKGAIQLLPTPDYKAMISSKTGYDIDNDPVWQYQAQPQPIERIAYYQCDHLGTPQELTDEQGDIAWAAHYKAWGEAHEALSTAAKRAGLKQPIRFQGQYFDHETGLHYNRHRYYDPRSLSS